MKQGLLLPNPSYENRVLQIYALESAHFITRHIVWDISYHLVLRHNHDVKVNAKKKKKSRAVRLMPLSRCHKIKTKSYKKIHWWIQS